jgi:hypothetical protein
MVNSARTFHGLNSGHYDFGLLRDLLMRESWEHGNMTNMIISSVVPQKYYNKSNKTGNCTYLPA